MTDNLISQLEIRRFRADEEDVNAYVQATISQMDKQEILSWIKRLPNQDLHALVTPYVTEKLSAELGEQELF